MTAASLGALLTEAVRRIGAVDARVLLCHVLDRDSAYLAAHPEVQLSPADRARYLELLERRARGEPVAYLAGRREFYGRMFCVSPAVLIPRPETELLVELALGRLPRDEPARVLDLGTGSGCIALSIASERSRFEVVALDQSPKALGVARRNAFELQTSNVTFVQSDWYGGLRSERFALIVSNPPYVAVGDPHLSEGDLRFEPRVALEAGHDGMEAIRKIVVGASGYLNTGGWLLLEHGFDQAERVRDLMIESGYGDVLSVRDLAGIERVTGGRLTLASLTR